MFLKYKWYVVLLLLAMAIFPEIALANAPDSIFGSISPTDKSIELLNKLFGNLGTFGPESSDAFYKVIGSFNNAVLIIGGVLVAYTIFISTVGTAHDGEMMGKKFSSVWVPIRTALGTMLVLPVINGTYCIMQAIVGWLIVQGVGLANTVWGEYINATTVIGTISNTSAVSSKSSEVAWNIFYSGVCMYGYENIIKDLDAQGKLSVSTDISFGKTPFDEFIIFSLDRESGYYYGATNGANGFKKDTCGKVSNTNTRSHFNQLTPGASQNGNIKIIDTQDLEKKKESIMLSYNSARDDFIKSIDNAAKSFASNPDPKAANEAVREALKTFNNKKVQAVIPIISDTANISDMSAAAAKDGWILAGAWYMRMSYLIDMVNKFVNITPEATGLEEFEPPNRYLYDRYYSKYGEAIKELKKQAVGSVGIKDVALEQSENIDRSGDFWIEKYIKSKIMSLGENVINDGDHPVMAMKAVGNYSLGIAAILGPGLWVVSNLLKLQMLIAIMPFLLTVFPVAIAVGFTLSFVLPMMPFMIWIGVVLGWLILCIEAIIAAPIWAVMHLSPHGDDMVGTGSQGYRLVLSLMLRPVLMVFGLIAALTVITVFGGFINQIFTSVFIVSQQDSGIIMMFLSIMAMPIIYAGLMWTLITKTMSIIHVIPDQLLQWFGGGGSQLGDYGNTIGGHGSQTFAATAGAASIVGRSIDVLKSSRDLKLQNDQAEASKSLADGDKKSRASNSFSKGTGNTPSGMNSALSVLAQQHKEQSLAQDKYSDISKAYKAAGDSEGAKMEVFASSKDGISQSNELREITNVLGGENSQLNNEFNKKFKDNVTDKNMSFKDAKMNAMLDILKDNNMDKVASFYQGVAETKGFGEANKSLRTMLSNTSSLTPSAAAEKLNSFTASVMNGVDKNQYANKFNELSVNGFGGSFGKTGGKFDTNSVNNERDFGGLGGGNSSSISRMSNPPPKGNDFANQATNTATTQNDSNTLKEGSYTNANGANSSISRMSNPPPKGNDFANQATNAAADSIVPLSSTAAPVVGSVASTTFATATQNDANTLRENKDTNANGATSTFASPPLNAGNRNIRENNNVTQQNKDRE